MQLISVELASLKKCYGGLQKIWGQPARPAPFKQCFRLCEKNVVWQLA